MASCDFETVVGAADADVMVARMIAAAASESAFISIPLVDSTCHKVVIGDEHLMNQPCE